MTLNRLGRSSREKVATEDAREDTQKALLKELKTFNDYWALATNETDPPTTEEDV